jgi:hypothetical protein
MTLQVNYQIPELPLTGVDFRTPELLMALAPADGRQCKAGV